MFSQIVCEWHIKVGKKAERFSLEGLEADEQIMSWSILLLSAGFGLSFQFGQHAMQSQALPNGPPVALLEGGNLWRRQGCEPRFFGLSYSVVGFDEDLTHRLDPGLIVEFDDGGELPQRVSVAEDVLYLEA